MTTIDMGGQVLARLRIEYSVVLYFTGEWGARLGGSFTLSTQSATHRFTPDVDPPEALAPMNNLLGQHVTEAEIGDNGSLSITFDDGPRLHAEPDADYEAWNVSGPTGLLVVSMPGGELAIWDAIAPAVDDDPADGASGSDDAHDDHAAPVAPAAAESRRRWRRRRGRATPRETASPAVSSCRVWRITVGCLLGVIDVGFVAAAAYLCWTLVWSGGPLDRMGWPFPAFFAGPPLIVVGAVYFAIFEGRRRRLGRPLLAIVVVAGLSVQAIGTGALQKVRWAQARPQVLAIADHPPARGTRQHRRFGTYWATVHANFDGTVLLEFDGSWNGLLYVPGEMPAYYRSGSGIGHEVMPRWWLYDTD